MLMGPRPKVDFKNTHISYAVRCFWFVDFASWMPLYRTAIRSETFQLLNETKPNQTKSNWTKPNGAAVNENSWQRSKMSSWSVVHALGLATDIILPPIRNWSTLKIAEWKKSDTHSANSEKRSNWLQRAKLEEEQKKTPNPRIWCE